MAFDNMLSHGRVADAACTDEDALAIRALDLKLAADARVHFALPRLCDGLALCLKI